MSLTGVDSSFQDLFGDNAATVSLVVDDLNVTSSILLDFVQPDTNLAVNSSKFVISEDKTSVSSSDNSVTIVQTDRDFDLSLGVLTADKNVVTDASGLLTTIDKTSVSNADGVLTITQVGEDFSVDQTPLTATKNVITDASGLLTTVDKTTVSNADGVLTITQVGEDFSVDQTPLTATKNVVTDASGLIITENKTTLVGTANQVLVVESPQGQWTLSTNQDINTTSAVTFATVNTGQGANELYAMNQDVETTDAVSFLTVNGTDVSLFANLTASEITQLENINSSTISTTQWGYLGAMNQGVGSTNNVTFATVNTGQGGNELYAMNQDVETTDNVTFADISLTTGTVSSAPTVGNDIVNKTYADGLTGSTLQGAYDNGKTITLSGNNGGTLPIEITEDSTATGFAYQSDILLFKNNVGTEIASFIHEHEGGSVFNCHFTADRCFNSQNPTETRELANKSYVDGATDLQLAYDNGDTILTTASNPVIMDGTTLDEVPLKLIATNHCDLHIIDRDATLQSASVSLSVGEAGDTGQDCFTFTTFGTGSTTLADHNFRLMRNTTGIGRLTSGTIIQVLCADGVGNESLHIKRDLYLANTATSAGGVGLNFYDKSTISTTFTRGNQTSGSEDVIYERIGTIVNMHIPAVSLANNTGTASTAMIMDTSIPSEYRPSTRTTNIIYGLDNNVRSTMVASIDTLTWSMTNIARTTLTGITSIGTLAGSPDFNISITYNLV
jgi:hypothetical protein